HLECLVILELERNVSSTLPIGGAMGYVDSAFQKQQHSGCITRRCSFVQGRATCRTERGHGCRLLKQDFQAIDLAVGSSVVKRCPSHTITQRRIGTSIDQERYNLGGIPANGEVQGT